PPPPTPTPFPYTTLFRSDAYDESGTVDPGGTTEDPESLAILTERQRTLWEAVGSLPDRCRVLLRLVAFVDRPDYDQVSTALGMPDRKSTRLNSSHVKISY